MSEPSGNTLEELLRQLPPGTPFFILDETLGVRFPPGIIAGTLADDSRTAAESFAARFGYHFHYDAYMGQWCFFRPKPPLQGQEYRSLFKLYSKDGKRLAEVLEFESGQTYLDEQEWLAGTTFKNRHGSSLVGPFASPKDAEKFIVTTPWFRGSRKNKRFVVLTIVAASLFTAGLVAFAWYTERDAEVYVCKGQPGTKYNVAKSECE